MENLTTLVAVYGAVLSTVVLVWNIDQSRAKLRIRFVHSGEIGADGSYSEGVRIEVQNRSQHVAHLNSVMLVYPWRKPSIIDQVKHVWKFRQIPTRMGWCHVKLDVYELDDCCPASIEPQKSHGVFVPQRVLDELGIQSTKPIIKAVAQDALWRNRYSKPFKYSEA